MRVRLYKPAKSAAQSGLATSQQWLIEPEAATPRLPEPIMGWASANDTFSSLKGCLRFPSQEDALAFAKNKGWEILITEPAERHVHPHPYRDTFRIVSPQDEEKATRKT
ncbi:MAG: ETC complex I subunit [Alphaproteobacteria bacterium]|nr:ETC complex I subunit [Alphaproteobacteria bacterium]